MASGAPHFLHAKPIHHSACFSVVISGSGSVWNWPELALKMTFNIFAAKRVFRGVQNDRIDDLVSANLRGQKCPAVRKFQFPSTDTATYVCPASLVLPVE